MTWTDPRTWIDGEVVDAALLNTHLRDNLKAIGDARTSFGSGSSWTAVTSNPSLGNGTWTGRYRQFGKHVEGSIRILMGSTTTFGSGGYRFTLPVTAFSALNYPIGTAFLNDASGSQQTGVLVLVDSTHARINVQAVGQVTNSSPWTWANLDEILLSFEYEAA